jgi:hypothetical protein
LKKEKDTLLARKPDYWQDSINGNGNQL